MPSSPVQGGLNVMKTVCLGWLRTHPAPIVLADDGAGVDGALAIGMCSDCAAEWMNSAVSLDARRRDLMREAYVHYLKGQEPDPRD
jgi:hypothetical protein